MQTKHKIYFAGLMCQIVMLFHRFFNVSYNVLLKRKEINLGLDLSIHDTLYKHIIKAKN